MTSITPLAHSIELLQTRLNGIENALARIQLRLETLPHPDPVQFPGPHKDTERLKGKYYCSFCGKSQDEVARLIAGPVVFICDECIELCTEIIREKRP